MKRTLRVSVSLAVLTLAGFRPAGAQVSLSDHQAFYALDFASSQLQYDAYDVVKAMQSGDSGTFNVGLSGDPATFVWEAAGTFPDTDVTTSNVTANPGSASATLTVIGPATLVGSSHYGYLSNPGEGLLTTSGAVLNFNALASDLLSGEINIALPGEWTAEASTPGTNLGFTLDGANQISNFTLPYRLSVSSPFTYDPVLGATFFRATAVPEPGGNALLLGMLFGSAGMAIRRRHR